MRYLLSRESRPILRRLAREHALCAFDFDGTLAPIVAHPEKARMRGNTRKLLARLADLYPCVVVSGRARADLLPRLDGVDVARVIGNHGAETERVARKSRRRIEQWIAHLNGTLEDIPGVWVEDKGLSLAVHFRQAVKKPEARRRILEACQELKFIHVFGGKQVINLVLTTSPDKGEALAMERARLKCKWVLYMGDDENDEAAFALGGNLVPVRIGRKRGSHARYYLRTQHEIDAVLELLVLYADRNQNGSDLNPAD